MKKKIISILYVKTVNTRFHSSNTNYGTGLRSQWGKQGLCKCQKIFPCGYLADLNNSHVEIRSSMHRYYQGISGQKKANFIKTCFRAASGSPLLTLWV